MSRARLTSFLVKVASRCNLDCDYCYVYHHADQSWRRMPRLLSDEHARTFARRLAEYASSEPLERIAVIFHGGEPLLAGHDRLVRFADLIRDEVGSAAIVEFGLQTNGLVLTDEALDAFQNANIGVSLSMDGPRKAHDLHRTTRKGRSSFDRVEAALERLKLRPSIFAGVIAVIDASVPPEMLLSYFAGHAVPKVDFLLPDSHHLRSPPGRDLNAGLYERWLVEAFDVWLDRYPELRVRTFEALLDAAAGLPSGTDAFGFGDVSLVTLETDGTWHDLDVLKVAGDGATRLLGSVEDTSIAEVAASDALAAHRLRIRDKAGLCAQCQDCGIVDICGGGAVPHRFDGRGYDSPTVYCREMKTLVAHAARRLTEGLGSDGGSTDCPPAFDVADFELAETSGPVVDDLYSEAVAADVAGLIAAVDATGTQRSALPACDDADDAVLRRLGRRAGTVAWQRALRTRAQGGIVRDVDGREIDVKDDYLESVPSPCTEDGALEVGRRDPWLRLPFGSAIVFEDEPVAVRGRELVREALEIVDDWRPAVGRELRAICSAIQFVRDPTAHPDKIVSFSDDSVPGALFVSIAHADQLIDPYDLADSLVHEYRHQKLYLLERRHPTTRAGALVVSPWREDLRPVSGLLHAAFVFVELGRFWSHVRDRGPARLHNRAVAQLEDTRRNLEEAFATLRSCELTLAGRALADVLEEGSRALPLAA